MAYKDAGIGFFGAFYMSSKESIKQFQEQYHITFPVGTARGVAKNLRVDTIPEAIFLSSEGKIVKRLSGKMSGEELTAAIEKILP